MKTCYRSVWISDVHLATRDSQSDVLCSFLDSIQCETMYLVGDIIDIWQLRRKWYWPNQYNEVVHKLLKHSRKGAKLFYIPGNHDDFFRNFIGYRFGAVTIIDEAIHETTDGRRFLVLHGDEFDTVVLYHNWLSRLGSWAYGYLVVLNRLVNALRQRCGKPYWSLSGAIKRKVKRAMKFLTRFEGLLVNEAARRKVDGVICGHIHQPATREIDGITYCNTGDWVENCTALVEHMDGRLELVWWHREVDDRDAELPKSDVLPHNLEAILHAAVAGRAPGNEPPVVDEQEREPALLP